MAAGRRLDYQDLTAGGILIVLGLAVAFYAAEHYPIGTVSRMGPGMFPTALGYLLAGIGVIIILPALVRRAALPMPEWRPMGFVLAAVLGFALTVELFGVVPAIFVLVGVSVLADNKITLLGALALATVLSILAVLIFLKGLGIPIYPFLWPF